ncbi:tripartite tricarboxylate transporter substrate binding protein [Metabacillus herbersteinensis]|uniref:Tripartite tricarboxylate transporter substrate binding protein n=1 Tax=Metabacillus herbersteinensis TaxID=283816 RepID=A0ABV6GEW7_9BACI
MKKIMMVLLILTFALSLAACNSGGQTASSKKEAGSGEDNFPNKPITLIVSYDAGGGTDSGARVLMPYVEKELGVAVNVVNKPGGSGWIGWGELARAKPDGYTIGYINSPNIITGYLDPKFKREENLDSFSMIANHVTDPGVIAIRSDEDRFSNIKELIEYAKTHKLTATTSGVGSNDHFAILGLNEEFGTQITPVHTKGAADGSTKVMGGHVDIFVAKVGEAVKLHESKQLKAISVLTKERSPFLTDVPTLEESGFDGVSSWSSRGIAAPKGVDEEKIEIILAALEKGIKNKEQVDKMANMGLQVDFKAGNEYMKVLKEDEQRVKDQGHLLGW